jgi:hypothetical protein
MHRKLFTDKDLFVRVSDKYTVRKYVKDKLGDQILNELYYVTDEPSDIPVESLPDEFVIKATHGSGWNIIVKNKRNVDINSIKSKCSEWLSKEYSPIEGEYWYDRSKSRVIVEKYIESGNRDTLLDYKFFVFHGEVKYIEVDFDRFSNHTRRIFTREWNVTDIKIKYPLGEKIEKPTMLDDMIEIAETLGEDFDFIRVDLYQPNQSEKIIFGELTLAHESGAGKFEPIEYDFKFGSYW